MDYNHGIFLRRFIFLVCLWKTIVRKAILGKNESAEAMFPMKMCYTFSAIILIEETYQVLPKSQGEADYIYMISKLWKLDSRSRFYNQSLIKRGWWFFCESDKLNNLTKERTCQIVSEICNVFSRFCLTAFLVFKSLLQNKLLYPNW